MNSPRIFPVLLALVLCGCGAGGDAQIGADGDSGTSTGNTTGTGTGNGTGTGTGSTNAGPPTFETDILPIIQNSCGSGDNNCHSRVAYGADANENCKGWLSLENVPLGSIDPSDGAQTGCPDLPLYERLTQLGSWQCFTAGAPDFDVAPREWKYVAPNDLEGSYLWQKVNGGVLCDLSAGELSEYMPITANLDPADLDTIEAWILAGAPKDADVTTTPTTGAVSCTITSPNPGDAFPFDEPVTVTGSCTGGATLDWTMANQGSQGTSGSVDVMLPVDGGNTLTLTGTSGTDVATATLTLSSVSPVVRILHPGDGDTRNLSSGAFPWTGSAVDRQDGDISDRISWWSSVDGTFGTGAGFDYLPSQGTHTVWAELQDNDGNTGATTITVTMIP